MATDGYCVKCKTKRTMKDDRKITMKNGKPATQGIVPGVRHQDVQDRRLRLLQRLAGRRAPLGGRSVSGR